ncbi:MAG: hypothetical protein HQK73_00190 [Desulfamplus sp.]|nr:hypothetical protein [Desulfamplus sp.]MBF0411128.1 hypothetical protein [Desulfamplus sp.]
MKIFYSIVKFQSVVIIILLTAICGTLHAAGSFDPCDLITKGEVEKFVGEPVGAPEHKDTKNPLGQKMCLYNTVSLSRLVQISVIRSADISKEVREGGQSAASIYKTTKEMLTPLEEVKGIGDDAFWAMPGLHILKGDIYILVSVGNTSKHENLEIAKKIAEKVLINL